MKCTNCGAEIGGKRFCPNCNAPSDYDGAAPESFPTESRFKKMLKPILNARFFFLLACLIVVILAQFVGN